MPKRKLTDPGIRGLPIPEKGQVEYFDILLPAFGIRVSYRGAKTWFVTVRVAGSGRQVRLKLGRFPGLSLTDARDAARDAMEDASKGIDPRRVREAEVAENKRQEAQTFSKLSEDFLEKHVERRLRNTTVAEYKRAFSRASAWRDRPVRDITRGDVIDLLDKIEARGHGPTADLTFAYLRTFFGWCVDRDIIEVSPCDRIKRIRNSRSRERVLTGAEIREVWPFLGELGYPFEPMFKLLILTGQRRNEVAGMRWDELRDWKSAAPWWELPGDRTKNGRPHLVPIVPAVKRIIDGCEQSGPYVFTTTGETPSTGYSRAKARLDKLIASARAEAKEPPMPEWRLHDFRRTMSTQMHERLNVSPHVVEAILNHVSGARAGVAGVYNRAAYLDERRSALERWAEWVMGASS